MSKRTERIEFVLNKQEKRKLAYSASQKGISVGEMLREYVKSLPEPSQDCKAD